MQLVAGAVAGSGLAVIAALAVAATPASAAKSQRLGDRPLPGFDSRVAAGRRSDRPAPVATLRARRSFAQGLGRYGVAETDPRTGGLRLSARLDGFLSGRDRRDAVRIALDYVTAHEDVVGLDASDRAALRLVRRYSGPDGVTHLTWAQEWHGIPAFDSGLKVNVAADGRIVNVLGAPKHALSAASDVPALSAGEALAAAADDAGASLLAPRATTRPGVRRETRFTGDHRASLVLFPGPERSVLAWSVELHAPSGEVYVDVIDATSGALLHRSSLTHDASGLAWENAPGAANGGTAAARDFSAWLDNPARLNGNNTHVYADVNADDINQAGEEIPPVAIGGDWSYPRVTASSPTGNCRAVGCTWNHAVANSWRGAADATLRQNATQVFYFVNRFHDHLAAAPISFDEAAGNFQTVNATGTGMGNDPLVAETSDGAQCSGCASGGPGLPDSDHLDNANMTVLNDGRSPRMQMYLFSGAYPGSHDVNGGDDASIVYHEYTHGMTGRMIIGPDGYEALDLPQSGAMGEGWSDWYAADFLAGEGLKPDTAVPGEIVLAPYAKPALRSQAMDCPVGVSAPDCPGTTNAGAGGYTFGDYGRVALSGPQVHADGEIWGETLWDLRQRLIADLGEATGIARTRSLITRAMQLSPPDPSFLDMRNAILEADSVAVADRVARGVPGGTDRARIWSVFAARGMGWFASTLDAADTEPVESFALPPTGPGVVVSGTITDADTNAALGGATVFFAGHFSGEANFPFGGFPADLFATTDGSGNYSIAAVKAGDYPQFVVSKPGYERVVDKATVSSGGATISKRLRRDWASASGGATLTTTGQLAKCPAAAAIDDSHRTGWLAGVGAVKSITVRLPATVNVTSFVVDPTARCAYRTATGDLISIGRSASVADYSIETAPDAAGQPGTFTTAATGTFDRGDNGRRNVVRPAAPAAAGVRYVRFVMISPQGPTSADSSKDEAWMNYMGMSELEVFAGTNKPPLAALAITPSDPLTGDPVTFDASVSSDPDGSIRKYEWDLDGNGTFETQTAGTSQASRSYDLPQTITVRVRVTDNGGDTAVATRPLVVDSAAEITDLGDLGGATASAGDINATDLVVGDAGNVAGGPGVHAFVFDGGAMQDLGGIAGQRDSIALAVNDAGQAVGAVAPNAEQTPGHAALFAGGTVTDLGTLAAGDRSRAFAINGSGTVVGSAQRDSTSGPDRAFLKPSGGPMTEIGTFGGTPANSDQSRAYDINASGQVVGSSEGPGLPAEHAFLWNGAGAPIDLGTLGGRWSVARAINDKGVIVGYGDTPSLTGAVHSFVRLSAGTLRDIGTLGGTNTFVRDINERGEIVGQSDVLGDVPHAFLYRNGRRIDLNSLLPAAAKADWVLLTANAINDASRVVGYGIYKGVERAYLLDLGDCTLCVEQIGFRHKRYPQGDFVDLPAGGTTDGNAVKVGATLHNKGSSSQILTVKFINRKTGAELPGSRISGLVLAAGQTTQVGADWDTTGLAWNSQGQPHPSSFLKVSLELGRRVLDSRTRALKVAPRPVFLVHGLLSNTDTWNAWVNGPGFVAGANPDWRAFAVPGLNTGSYGAALGQPNTIYDNATVLRDYVEAKRDALDAWHVDLVGHSMGGLISRQYVASLMPNSPDANPVVRRLVMLGTPNQGSACAELMPLPITYELRPEVAAAFNARVTDTRGVAFSLVAGNALSFTCQDPTAGDSVVSLPSARWTLTDTTTRAGLLHTDMTGSQAVFGEFAKPHLISDQPPVAARSRALAARVVPQGATPQLVAAGQFALAANGSLDVPLPVGAATRLGFNLIAPATVGSTLLDPDGQAIAMVAAGSAEAAGLFRNADIASPKTGTWVLRLTSSAATQVSLSAWVKGSPLDLAAEAGTQNGDGTVPLRATLRDGANPGTGAAVTATVSRLGGQPTTLTLLDDGLHDDDAANDGTYGATTAPLAPAAAPTDAEAPGGHLVVVRAVYGQQVRLTTTSTLATAAETAPPTGTLDVAAGELDPTFGRRGKVVTPIGSDASAFGVAIQPDGKIVAAGRATNPAGRPVLTLARYREDGTLDPTFGTDGVVVGVPFSPFAPGGFQRIVDVALQPDGRILIGGGQYDNGMLARYTANGALDLSFGGGDGIAPLAPGSIHGIGVQPDGQIVVAGYAIGDGNTLPTSVTRYTSAGALDPSFGTNGTVTVPPPPETPPAALNRSAIAYSLAVDSTGRIILAGSAQRREDNTLPNPWDDKLTVLRLTVGGAIDTSFGGDGWSVLDPVPYDPNGLNGQGFAPAYEVIALPDGKIAVAGYEAVNAYLDQRFLVVRLNSDGAPDTSFDGDGIALTGWGGSLENSRAWGMARQADGKLVVAGSRQLFPGDTSTDFALARYDGVGTLDQTFSGDGRFAPVFTAGDDAAYAVAVQGDGRIVLVGSVQIDRYGSGAFGIARVLGADTTFHFSKTPPACVDGSGSTQTGQSVTVGLSCSDAGGDPFTYAIVSGPAHGTVAAVDQALGTVAYTPAAGFSGSDSFTFKATDADGDSNVATVTISVIQPPPPPPPPPPDPPETVRAPTPTPTPSPGGGGSGGGADGRSRSCVVTASGCPVQVQCPPATPGGCNGDISGRITGGSSAVTAAAIARGAVVLKGRFRIPAGATRKVRLKLTPAGRRLLRKRARLRVTLTITTRDGAGHVFRKKQSLIVKRGRR